MHRFASKAVSFVLACSALSLFTNTHAASIAEIKSTKTMVVGINGMIPPFQYKAGGLWLGYEIEIVRAMAARMGVEPVFKDYPQLGALEKAVKEGKVDMAIGTVATTSTRDAQVDLTTPYACLGAALMTLNPNLKTHLDMKGKHFGIIKDTVYQSYVEKLPFDKKVTLYESPEAVTRGFLAREFDAGIAWKAMVPFYSKVMNASLQDTPVLWSIPVGIMVKSGNNGLRLTLNNTLAQLKRDPKIQELNKKYFPNEDISCSPKTTP